MTERSVTHATLVFERTYEASPARVFAAWADPEARARWGPPLEDEVFDFVESDFRVGGRDINRCGPAGNPMYRVETHYGDIVPGERIVFTETVAEGETRLSVALVTVVFEPEGGRTRLTLTDQVAALDGSGMVEGSQAGWDAALDNIAAELRREPATA